MLKSPLEVMREAIEWICVFFLFIGLTIAIQCEALWRKIRGKPT